MKSKKKKLVVEGDLNSQVTLTLNKNTNLLNEEEVVKNIGAHIGMEYKVIDRNFVGVVGSWSGMSYKILFGDFNVVRSQDEHLGSFFDVIEANSFNDFIAHVGVFDFPLGLPKKGDPLSFSDYRPISLIGCVYKVISKILSNRLAKVIGPVIGPNQSEFIVGRQILDEILIANEVIRMASIENLKLLQFKVDFEKAFDSVNWNFLLDIIRQMGFSLKWITWISSCLSSASISILINGSPSKEFKLEIGNITKSRLLGVGVPCNKVELMTSSLGCTHDSLPFTYLGLPVGKKMCGCDVWNSIISRRPNVINILEAIRCRFFWGFKDSQRGISWFKWNTILLDRDKGGLGFGSLLAKNLGLLGKWKWRFLIENNSLWREVINEFYGNDGGFGSSPSSYHVGGIWHDINKAASSIGNIVLSIWKAFGENTRDLGSFGEETDKTTNLHQHLSRMSTQKLETASQITRDVHRQPSQDMHKIYRRVRLYDPEPKLLI
ncbi:cysteine-rich receptor-like protein kinase [Tanacetum coccineum]